MSIPLVLALVDLVEELLHRPVDNPRVLLGPADRVRFTASRGLSTSKMSVEGHFYERLRRLTP